MLLLLTLLAGLSLLSKYILIPGCEAWSKGGRQVELTWLGLDRHGWSEVQMYLTFLLLGLMLLSLLTMCTRPASLELIASAVIVAAITFVGLAFLMPVEVIEGRSLMQADVNQECCVREKVVPKKAKKQKRSDYWPKDGPLANRTFYFVD